MQENEMEEVEEQLSFDNQQDLLASKSTNKKQKKGHDHDQLSRSISCGSSRLFQSFRAIGLIADDLPMCFTPMGTENFLTVSIGKAFQVYKCEKLTVAIVSPTLPKRIHALESKNGLTFTACRSDITIWKRIAPIGVLTGGHFGKIIQLMAMGSNDILLSIASDGDRQLCIWNVVDQSLLATISFPPNFTPVQLLHPHTYLNKVLVASAEGGLQLWNIRKQQCIYDFATSGSLGDPASMPEGSLPARITCMQQSPAVDVIALGLSDGRVILHHLKVDKTLMTFQCTSDHAPTSLSFRTDAAKVPMLAVGTQSGDVSIWNLRDKKLASVIVSAHNGKIVSTLFLPHEPILITLGDDNCIKMWIFDQTDGSARLLKSREGHKSPPTRIRYYGGETLSSFTEGSDGTSCQILSSSRDRSFRVFHTAREQQSREMSQGHLTKKAKAMQVDVQDVKLSPIVNFASIETRGRDWANIVTCHEDDANAYVWHFDKRAMGPRILTQANVDAKSGMSKKDQGNLLHRIDAQATSSAISMCGNFALIGTLGGGIFKYNMQSGEKRGSFPTALTSSTTTSLSTTSKKMFQSSTLKAIGRLQETIPDDSMHHKHTGMVSGLAVDALNRIVVSCSVDGSLKFWDFRSHALMTHLSLGTGISSMELHRESNLVVVTCDDLVLRVYDLTTYKLVRRFAGHTHRITNVIFSTDARWLLSSSDDRSLRVWDLPTGRCIDWLCFPKAVTALTVSPTGEFFATSHVGSVGIFLWANRASFTHVFLDQEPNAPFCMDMPQTTLEVEGEANQAEAEGEAEDRKLKERQRVEEGEGEKEKDDNKQNATLSTTEPVATATTSVLHGGGTSLVTLSTAPRAFWQTLFHLELIRQRNKPVEPPRAPEKAPFFLPTVRTNEVDPSFQRVEKKETSASVSSSTLKKTLTAEEDTPLTSHWVDATSDDDDDNKWASDEDDDNVEAIDFNPASSELVAQVHASQLLHAQEAKDEMDTEEDSLQTCPPQKKTTTMTLNAKPTTASTSRIVKTSGFVSTQCQLGILLKNAAAAPHELVARASCPPCENQGVATTRRFEHVATYLHHLAASSVDVELSTLCLGIFDVEGRRLLRFFLEFIQEEIESKRCYQVNQVYLNRFLKLYNEIIAQDPVLLRQIAGLYAVQKESWNHLHALLQQNMCLVQYFSKIQT